MKCCNCREKDGIYFLVEGGKICESCVSNYHCCTKCGRYFKSLINYPYCPDCEED